MVLRAFCHIFSFKWSSVLILQFNSIYEFHFALKNKLNVIILQPYPLIFSSMKWSQNRFKGWGNSAHIVVIILPINMLINLSLKCQEKYECQVCCEFGSTDDLINPAQENKYLLNRKQNRILQVIKINYIFSDFRPHTWNKENLRIFWKQTSSLCCWKSYLPKVTTHTRETLLNPEAQHFRAELSVQPLSQKQTNKKVHVGVPSPICLILLDCLLLDFTFPVDICCD